MITKYIHLRETQSTNTYLSKVASMLPTGTVIYTWKQVEGRGQRGNAWESEPEKNLTFSLLLRPEHLLPRNQFYLSEAVSLAIVNTLSVYAPDFSVKWPNDIYYKDKKVCGILIEHSISGEKIDHTIIGVGLNVNQLSFVSDAPNPVSLAQIIGTELDAEKLLHDVADNIVKLADFSADTSFEDLHQSYLDVLYRNDAGYHKFEDANGTIFEAQIIDVQSDGIIVLKDDTDNMRRYAFKEMAFVID
ncbi:MAG: biotin--[acetyl-CoA-carboxylase] ligase [Muribaculaceae bacterium]